MEGRGGEIPQLIRMKTAVLLTPHGLSSPSSVLTSCSPGMETISQACGCDDSRARAEFRREPALALGTRSVRIEDRSLHAAFLSFTWQPFLLPPNSWRLLGVQETLPPSASRFPLTVTSQREAAAPLALPRGAATSTEKVGTRVSPKSVPAGEMPAFPPRPALQAFPEG